VSCSVTDRMTPEQLPEALQATMARLPAIFHGSEPSLLAEQVRRVPDMHISPSSSGLGVLFALHQNNTAGDVRAVHAMYVKPHMLMLPVRVGNGSLHRFPIDGPWRT
jgi:hypothetical protein